MAKPKTAAKTKSPKAAKADPIRAQLKELADRLAEGSETESGCYLEGSEVCPGCSYRVAKRLRSILEGK